MYPLMWLAELAVIAVVVLWMSWQSKSNELFRQRVRQLEAESTTTRAEQRTQKHQIASLHARLGHVEQLQDATL